MIKLWTDRSKLVASYRVNGELEIRTLAPAEYTGFVRSDYDHAHVPGVIDSQPDFPGWRKLWFVDYDRRKQALEQNQTALHEADVSPARRFLSDHNCKIDPPLRCDMDMETDSTVSFPQAIEGFARTLSWAAVGPGGESAVGLLEDDDDQAEAELLAEFWKYLGRYDQIGAWGGDRFDFPVLEKRSGLLARKFSKIMQPYWEHRRRLLFIDHLALFKRHHMAPDSGDDKTSFKLGDVAQALVGEGKDEVPEELRSIVGKGKSMGGATRKLWDAGGAARQALVKYNLQDTVLLGKIEAATGYYALQQTIAEVTHTFADSHGIKPMAFVDGYLLKCAHRRKTHFPSKKQPTGDEQEYEGAFVMDTTIKGIMRTVHVCDFKSLYPTCIRTWNLGSETKGLEGCTAANGIKFGTETESMLAECCRDFMDLRDFYKKEMNKCVPGTEEHKAAERKSKAYKIANNSVYGVGGCVWSRIYDVEIVEAITLGAQMLLKATRDAAIERGWKPIAGDTDSLFIGNCTVEEFSAFVKWCNDVLYPQLLDEAKCKPEFRCIGLAYEKCFDRLIAPQGKDGSPASKRYAGSYLHYGGVAGRPIPGLGETYDKKKHSKPEIKGLEYMRGDSIRYARNMQKECLWKILGGETNAEALEEWVLSKRTAFMERPIDVSEIVMSKSISKEKLSDYKVAGPHVRIAEQMQARGEDVGEGTRIAYVVTDGGKSPTEVISVDDYAGAFDRHFYWQKVVYPATMRVLAGAFPDKPWSRWVGKRPKAALPGQLTFAT